jgi:hypothetical protein
MSHARLAANQCSPSGVKRILQNSRRHDASAGGARRYWCRQVQRHSFAVPAGTSSLFGSARIVLSEPFGADCIPGGVSPWGLDAGAPPPDPVLIGPVFPCGCVTLPPELVLVDGSPGPLGLLGVLGFDWEKAGDATDKAKVAVRATSIRLTPHLLKI